jgi:endoglucanase
MKQLFKYFLFTGLLSVSLFSKAVDISLNTLGYLPNEIKIATVSPKFNSFKVLELTTGEIIYEASTSDTVYQKDVNRTVRFADFSKISKEGTYFIQLSDSVKSCNFQISDNVFNSAFITSMRAFYLWRCGMAVEGTHNGIFYSHNSCHLEDGWLDSIGISNKKTDGTGGWHDAGDHGKYVVNAGITVGMMFIAWEQFNDKLKNLSLNIPETAPGYPDYLKELKWETDWLLKMAYPDGSGRISHKLTRTNFEGFIMPEDDKEKRFFTEWGSCATADFVAVMAQAARYFKPYDKAYSKKCLEAAILSYNFLQENRADHKFSQRGFRTGGYHSSDEDDRLWAAVEMWETTGKDIYLKDFEMRLSSMKNKVNEDWDWGDVRNLATYTYILSSKKGRNEILLDEAKKQAIQVAENIVLKSKKDIYSRPLGEKYYWGCNGTVVRQVFNLFVANKLNPDTKYRNASLDAINHVFGRNYYGRSYVTGLGYLPPMNPHDRRSGADNIPEPWPGYIVGGGQNATDWLDDVKSYSTNEVAINWQAALVFALADFINY